MLHSSFAPCGSPHVIVVGNEKGGSGKTTITIHLVLALMKAGQRVATIDLDSRQNSLTRYLANRRAWAARTQAPLELPTHFSVARRNGTRLDDNEAAEFADFDKVVGAVQHGHDFVVIDTPPNDSFLMRLAHLAADTLVTPLNDSFLDLGALAAVDPVSLEVTGIGHYGRMVREARRRRRQVDGASTDWIVVHNRLSLAALGFHPRTGDSLDELAPRLGFRVAAGLAERVAYRDYFSRGLTALDDSRDLTGCDDIGPPHPSVRSEVATLLRTLRLPLDERGRRRAGARAEWFATCHSPIEIDDII
jgi:chromosome partitioning protein